MKKTSLIFSILCFCMIICFFGCSTGKQPSDAASTQDTSLIEESTPEKEKTAISLAGVNWQDSRIKRVITEFNKTSSDYTVSMIDYGITVSQEQGEMALQTQMQAGNIPDLLIFDRRSNETAEDLDAISPLPYISGGMLMDLDPLIEDGRLSFDREDCIIWDALHEFGGMYLIGPKFRVHALYCLPEIAEQYQGWTLEDYLALQDSLSENQKLMYYMEPMAFIEYVGSRYIHDAVDVTNATCDFETPELISVLEAACHIKSSNAQEDHIQDDGSFKGAPEMMLEGSLYFCETQLNSAFDVSFDRFRAKTDYPMGYLGYPTPDGSNGMYIDLPYAVGICAGTDQLDGCLTFLNYMLQHPIYQDAYDGTPLFRSQLAGNLKAINDMTTASPWVTEQIDQDALVSAAATCRNLSYFDMDILGIIEEEAAPVLAGERTAEDAAARIQERASILVAERYE